MQQIDPIHNLGYNANGHTFWQIKAIESQKYQTEQALRCLTFDAVELSGHNDESYSWLVSYINSF